MAKIGKVHGRDIIAFVGVCLSAKLLWDNHNRAKELTTLRRDISKTSEGLTSMKDEWSCLRNSVRVNLETGVSLQKTILASLENLHKEVKKSVEDNEKILEEILEEITNENFKSSQKVEELLKDFKETPLAEAIVELNSSLTISSEDRKNIEKEIASDIIQEQKSIAEIESIMAQSEVKV